MAEAMLMRMPNGALLPNDDESRELVGGMKIGQAVRCKLVKVRNYKFHQKWFTLAQMAYDIWSETVPPAVYRGQAVQPNFERFRKDLTILAGFFTSTFNVRGDVRLEAKSLSFASMGQDEFEVVYSKTIDAVMANILGNARMSEAELRSAVDRVLAYD